MDIVVAGVIGNKITEWIIQATQYIYVFSTFRFFPVLSQDPGKRVSHNSVDVKIYKFPGFAEILEFHTSQQFSEPQLAFIAFRK